MTLMTRLVVPQQFNRNAADVQSLGTQTETGTWLIEYMCERLEVCDLGGLDVLDFGCGCRFAEAIVNNTLAIGSYTGIDLDFRMINWLTENVRDDPRLSFHCWNALNPVYNPTGFPVTPETPLPTDPRRFDVICMFSVITHQLPEDTATLFRILRRYIKPRGRMFFSANLRDMPFDYYEMGDQPTASSAYSWPYLHRLLKRAGWRVLTRASKGPLDQKGREMPIQDSILCAPVGALHAFRIVDKVSGWRGT